MELVIANGALAAALFGLLGDVEGLRPRSPELRAFAIGIGYLALIRLKFTTFNFHENEVPFGIEAFYEAAKTYAYKRINRIAKDARYAETQALASSASLADLASRARLSIEQDMLIDFEEKRRRKDWLTTTLSPMGLGCRIQGKRWSISPDSRNSRTGRENGESLAALLES